MISIGAFILIFSNSKSFTKTQDTRSFASGTTARVLGHKSRLSTTTRDTSIMNLTNVSTNTVKLIIAGNQDVANQDGTTIRSFKASTNWIGNAGSTTSSYTGLRFTGQSIPVGAQIQSAQLEITSSKTDWEVLNLNIYGENSDNSQPFSSSELFSNRPLTTTFKSVSLDQKWYQYQKYTFDVTAPLQELVNNGKTTNGIVTFISKGTGKSYNYYFFYNALIPDKAPTLTITYTSQANVTPTTAPLPTPTVAVQASITPTPTLVPTSTPSPTPIQSGSWWKPTTAQPIHWHWQLSDDFVFPRDVVPGATVYDIDGEYTSAATVAQLHSLGPNVKVICYMDAGVYETYRSDASSFPSSVIGNADTGWNGSYWLDIRQISILKPIMENRIKNWCKGKGFDAVEPDETEVWSNNSGFPITKDQNNAYNMMIADLAHSYNLSVALKGNTTEAPELYTYFDFTINEQCWQYNECSYIKSSFIDHGKAAFNIEYSKNLDMSTKCPTANLWHMNSAKRDLNLVGPTNSSYLYQPCVDNTINTWP